MNVASVSTHSKGTALYVDTRMPAHRAVPLQADHAALLRLGDELLLERLGGEPEDHVHHRPALPLDRGSVEGRVRVDGAVEARRLLAIESLHGRQAAEPLQPGEHVADHVDAEGGRRVVERLVLGVGPELEDLGDVLPTLLDELLRHDGDHDARGADVLLGAGVDDAEPRHVEGAPEEVTRHVADERNRTGARVGARGLDVELHAVDGLVGGEVEVGGGRIDLHLGRGGDADVALLLAIAGAGGLGRDRGSQHGRHHLALADRLLAPGAGDQVLGRLALLHEVHGDLGEEHGGAALQEEDLVRGRHGEQVAQQRERLVVDGLVLLAAVAVLHDRHATSGEVEELLAGPLERGERQGCGTGVEVHLAGHGVPPCGVWCSAAGTTAVSGPGAPRACRGPRRAGAARRWRSRPGRRSAPTCRWR